MPWLNPVDVANHLGTPIDLTNAAAALESAAAMVRAYTRGRGFIADDEPNTEVAAVIVSVAARMVTNPTGLQQTNTTGQFTETIAGWQGLTLLERLVLDRYRKKAK